VTTTLHITGMTCGSCVRHVKDALLGISGVSSADVHLENTSATVESQRDISTEEFSKALEDAGYAIQ
jgi:copper chaperone CopZ